MKRDIQLDPALKGQMPLNWLWKQVGYFSHVALVTTMTTVPVLNWLIATDKRDDLGIRTPS